MAMLWQESGNKSKLRIRPHRKWHPEPGIGQPSRLRRLWRKRRQWPVLVMLAVIFSPLSAQEISTEDHETSPSSMQSGSLLLRMKSGYRVATRMNTDISADISGMVARVSVKQSFRNDGQEWVEGVYVFPLPDRAAVDRLRMRIGERFIEGEVQEKEQARKEYEAAKVDGKKASLVEQQRANLFTTSLANIGPGETVIIEIEYLETIVYDEERFSLRFPITTTPRYIPGNPLPGRKGSGWSPDTDRVPDASLITPPFVTQSRDHAISFSARINAGVPLNIIASRYHPIDVENQQDSYLVTLSGSDIPMDHDIALTWRPVADAAPRAMLFTESIAGKPHALLMMLPPTDNVQESGAIPRELIFVIDTSGSMHGTSISQAVRALHVALDGLNPEDRFNVMQFNSITSALFPVAVDATRDNIDIAKRYVSGLSADGGTEMRPAIEQALMMPRSDSHLRQVIFVTDGSVGNEKELFGVIDRHLGSSRLFTIGIGSAPNSWFMRKAAETGRGTFTFISALHEVNEKMSRLFRKLEQPQVTDVVVEWPNGVTPLAYPESIPDLYAGEPVVVKARLDSEILPDSLVKISGNSTLGTWGAELSFDLQEQSSGIAALWARARIEDLLDKESRGANAEETRAAVVQTALAHHLVSKFTSLVAIDKTPTRPLDAALGSEQVPNLLPYGQSQRAIIGFPATATSAGRYQVIGVLLMFIAVLLLLFVVPKVPHREPDRESGK